MLTYHLNQSAAPANEPLTTAQAKLHLNIETAETFFDAYLDDLVKVARELVETETGLQLITATWELYLPRFPQGRERLYIPIGPVLSITNIDYPDTAGVAATINVTTGIQKTIHESPAYLTPAYDASWPAVRQLVDGVKITFTAGHGSTLSSNARAEHLVRLLVAHWFRHREPAAEKTFNQIPLTARRLIDQLRLPDEFHAYGEPSVHKN